MQEMATVGTLEEEARKRKERLRAFARKSKVDDEKETVTEKQDSEETEKEKLPRYKAIFHIHTSLRILDRRVHPYICTLHEHINI